MDKKCCQKDLSAVLFFITSSSAFLFYLKTLCPTITWGDPAKLAVFAKIMLLGTGGAAHPLHTVIGHFWGLLLFSDYAFGQNLLSAVFAALTVGVIALIAFKITASFWAGLGAGIALAVAHTFWWLAVINESYSLLYFLLSLALLFALCWRESKKNTDLFFTFLFLGLGVCDHYLAVIFIPFFILYFVLDEPRLLVCPRVYLVAIAGGLLGLSLLIFILNESGTCIITLLRSLLVGETKSYYRDFHKTIVETISYTGYLFIQFPVFGFILGFLGLFTGFKKSWKVSSFFLLLFFGDIIFSAGYMFERQFNLMVPSYMIFAVWIGIGCNFVIGRMRKAKAVLLLVLVVAPISLYYSLPAIFSNRGIVLQKIRTLPYRNNNRYFYLPDKSGYTGARRFGEEAFAVADKNSVIIGDFTPLEVLRYLQVVEGKRKDIYLKSIDALGLPIGPLKPEFVQRMIEAGKAVYICDKDDYHGLYRTDDLEALYNFVPVGPIYKIVRKK